MLKLFGIPNCDTVKKAKAYLEKKNQPFEFIDFKKTPPTEADILRWEKSMGQLPVNSKGLTYKKHKEEYEALSAKERITFIITHASMIKRPILEKNSKVLVLGFKEGEYNSALEINVAE